MDMAVRLPGAVYRLRRLLLCQGPDTIPVGVGRGFFKLSDALQHQLARLVAFDNFKAIPELGASLVPGFPAIRIKSLLIRVTQRQALGRDLAFSPEHLEHPLRLGLSYD